jgi:hypothetical protein
MKIFLGASIHGKAKYQVNYQLIADEAQAQGHTVLSDHVLGTTQEVVASGDQDADLAFHRKVMDGLKQADALFAEVSYPSTSVGYLVSVAVQMGKPVVVFYSGTEEPHLFRSLEKTNDKFQIIRYNSLENLKSEIPFAAEFVSSVQDVRFNFFISPELSVYLDWIARNRKIPRSVYLRNLIDADMVLQNDFMNT